MVKKLIMIALMALHAVSGYAAEINAFKASAAASKWASSSANLHGMALGTTAKAYRTFSNGGTNLFNIVQMEGGGFIITSADNGITPIIAFSESDDFVATEENPLFALLMHDMPERIKRMKQVQPMKSGSSASGSTIEYTEEQIAIREAEEDWEDLLDDSDVTKSGASSDPAKAGAASSVSDTRVSPLIKSKWSQSTVDNKNVYNYYTPNNYVCGCVATAFAQVMLYHRYPTISLDRRGFSCEVSGEQTTLYTKPGAFDWNNMPLVPLSVNINQQEAIGKLTYNVGVASQMSYKMGGSGAVIRNAVNALVNYFGYASAKSYSSSDAVDYVEDAILSNLDYGKPVCLGVFNSSLENGHCVVVDGYGFNGKYCYTHINLGWGGYCDAWYNLPAVNTKDHTYDQLRQIAYNIFPSETGEIISGRVLNSSGTKISSASVVVKDSSGKTLKTATTNSRGIWAVVVPSSATYTVTATSGSMSGSVTVTVGRSSSVTGNRWGQDITIQGEVPGTTCTVTFHANGGDGTMAPQQFDQGVPKALTENRYERTGHTFAGWSKTSTGLVTYKNRERIAPFEDMALYAVWHRNSYTLTCDANGGVKDGPTTYTMTYDSIVNASIGQATHSGGFQFKGWWTEKIGGEQVFDSAGKAVSGKYWSGGKWMCNYDLTVYAQWEGEPPMTYTVTFDSNGGSGVMEAQTFTSGVMQSLRANGYSRGGCIFLGWATSAGGSVEYSNGQSVEVYSDMVLYAIWEKIVKPEFIISGGVLTGVELNGAVDVEIPTDVERIDEYAFAFCSNLVSVTIPDSVTSIGACAFYECIGLTSVAIGNGVTDIGEYSFVGCESLSSFIIPNSVTNIGSCAFERCRGLTSVTIGDGVKRIESAAFYGCSGLTTVTIPKSVTYISDNPFTGCSSLTSFSVAPENVVYRAISGLLLTKGGESLVAVPGGLTSVTVPDGVTSIGNRAFCNCSGLTNVTIPNSVTDIGFDAFYGCSKLTSVTIPNSVTSIGGWAFCGCGGLTSVTIPNSVTSIGDEAFYNCSGLTSVTIPNSVTEIGWAVFYDCYGLTSVTIPNSVTSIGFQAFEGCSGLTSVTIPESITNIGWYAFARCSGLTNVTIPDSVTSIRDHAFSDCSGLISVKIPNSVTSIGESAFVGCNKLKSFTVTDGNPSYKEDSGLLLTKDGTVLVAAPGGVTSVTIPNCVRSIEASAFSGCGSLTSVTIPNSVTNIGDYAFGACVKLESVTIPSSVEHMGRNVFGGCKGLKSLIFEGDAPDVDVDVFYYYSYLWRASIVTCLVSRSSTGWGVDIPGVWHGVDIAYDEWVVQFNANGGTGTMMSQTFPRGATQPLTANAFTRSGYTFAGWATNVIGNVVYTDRQSITPAASMTLYATWTVKKPTYSVAFDKNASDATGMMSAQTFTKDVMQVLTANAFTRTGYTFAGWATSANGSVVYTDKQSIAVPASLTLYAKWTANTYTVTLNANGGSVSPLSKAVTYDTAYGELPKPTRNGYLFAGWFTAASGGTKISATSKVAITAAQTLYAHWNVRPERRPKWNITADGRLLDVELNGVTDVTIPEGVTSIADFAFDGLDVTSVQFPSTLKGIGSFAFFSCKSLTSVKFSANMSSMAIGQFAFAACSSLTGVFELPEGVTRVGYRAFSETGIEVLVLPSSLEYLGGQQTAYGTPLREVWFSGNAPEIPEPLFSSEDLDSPYCDAREDLVTYVPLGSTGWKDATSALPSVWPTKYGMEYGRAIRNTNAEPPSGTSGYIGSSVSDSIDDIDCIAYSGRFDPQFKTAQTVLKVLYDTNDKLVGTIQLKTGKVNTRHKTVKLSAKVTLITNGKASVITSKSISFALYSRIDTTLIFKAPIGDMTFKMAEDGSFTLKNDSYRGADATIGGALKKGGAQGTFRLEGFDLAVPGEVQDQLLPMEETFSISGTKWLFGKNAGVKWAKPKKGVELPEVYDEASGKGLIVDDAGGKTNLSSLKLTYTAETGLFKGSFKAYALEGTGKATKLKKYTVNVVGFVVDGVGCGEASCKKPAAGPWIVTVE